jgi:hypothetical protein
VGWRLRSWSFRLRQVVRGKRGCDAPYDTQIKQYTIIYHTKCQLQLWAISSSVLMLQRHYNTGALRIFVVFLPAKRLGEQCTSSTLSSVYTFVFPFSATLRMGTGSSRLISALVTWVSGKVPLRFSTRPATMRGNTSRYCHVSNPSPLPILFFACLIGFFKLLGNKNSIIFAKLARLVINTSSRAGNSVVECRTAALQSNLPEVTGSTPVRPFLLLLLLCSSFWALAVGA